MNKTGQSIVVKFFNSFAYSSLALPFTYQEFGPKKPLVLRKQTSLIGHPIVGDDKYSTSQKKNKKLMLHASNIKFKIAGKNLEYSANLPDHFLKFLKSTNLNYLSI